MSRVVATSMFDAIPLAQCFGRHVTRDDVTKQVVANPSNKEQRPFLEWYDKNWQMANHCSVKCEAGTESAVNNFLARNARGVKLDRVVSDGLVMATVTDISGGLSSGSETVIVANDKMYKAIQLEMRGLKLYKVNGLAVPLLHLPFHDLWIAMPNVMATHQRELDLFEFATHTMKHKREIYKPAEEYAYVEIPQVDVMIRRRLDWMQGLQLSGETILQVMQACRLELTVNSWGKAFNKVKPNVLSETLTGLPPITFDRDLVIWKTPRGEHVSPVLHVPVSSWEKI